MANQNGIIRSSCFTAALVGLLAMAVRAQADVVYAATADLVSIDETNGTATTIGALSGPMVIGMAFDPNSNTLYGVNEGDLLVTIDIGTGAVSNVGSGLGFSNIAALAFDPNTNTLYGTDFGSDELVTINTTSGAAALVGSLGSGFDAVSGLAFDSNNNVLYGVDDTDDELLTINTSTGAASTVGFVGNSINSLGFHGPTNTLYGTSNGNLYSIIPTSPTVSVTSVGSTTSSIEGLTAIPEPSVAWYLLLIVAGRCWGNRRLSHRATSPFAPRL